MPQEANDIDELEALLSGLSDDELNQLEDLDAPAPTRPAPVTDADVSDAELVELEEIAEAPTKPTAKRRPRNLKPLTDTKPASEAVKAAVATSEEDELAALAELDTPTTTSAPAMDAKTMEELAEKVIAAMAEIQLDHPELSDEEFAAKTQPVLNKIDGSQSIEQIEAALRDLFNPPKKTNSLPTQEDVNAALLAATGGDAELATMLGAVDLNAEDPELAELAEERVKTLDQAKTVSLEEVEAKVSEDAELEALLAATAPSPALATTTAPAPTKKPIAVTPMKKAGALNTFIDADQLQKDLTFTEASINMAMTRQAALFAHYARMSADATFQADRAKQQVELLEAQLNQRFRDAMVTSGTKFTEKSIDALVIQDSSYQAAQERAHEAKAIASMVATAADSFRHRKDMLIQVGADLRLEKQGELRMKEHPGQRAMEQLEKN